MKLLLGQINIHLGDIATNEKQILAVLCKAQAAGADVLVLPEAALCGAVGAGFLYADILEHLNNSMRKIAAHSGSVTVVTGGVRETETGIKNTLFVLREGDIQPLTDKVTEDYAMGYLSVKNKKIALGFAMHIKEKILRAPALSAALCAAQADMCIDISTDVFTEDAAEQRGLWIRQVTAAFKKPYIHLNIAGAQTQRVFDGNSRIVVAEGETHFLSAFAVQDYIWDTERPLATVPPVYTSKDAVALWREEGYLKALHQALLLGVRDYFEKNGFKRAVYGLSGGIDSALVHRILWEALGRECLCPVLLPSAFSTPHSRTDALQLCANTGVRPLEIPINSAYETIIAQLKQVLGAQAFGVAHENLQSRLRALYLMWVANTEAALLINTSNKSELSVGYGTLYGDLCGALSIIGDLYKTQVYALAQYLNGQSSEKIPLSVLQKAPSAELRPEQKDSDTLPDYAVLDLILYYHTQKKYSEKELIAHGFEASVVAKTLYLKRKNAYKGYQTPPVLHVCTPFSEGLPIVPLRLQ